jgi:hypothetical protein
MVITFIPLSVPPTTSSEGRGQATQDQGGRDGDDQGSVMVALDDGRNQWVGPDLEDLVVVQNPFFHVQAPPFLSPGRFWNVFPLSVNSCSIGIVNRYRIFNRLLWVSRTFREEKRSIICGVLAPVVAHLNAAIIILSIYLHQLY